MCDRWTILPRFLVGLGAISVGSKVNVVAANEPPDGQPRLTREILTDAFSVFTLTIAQNTSLDAIQQRFPDLREQVLESRNAFDKAFRSAVDATDACLKEHFGLEWDQRKKAIYEAVKAVDNSTLSRTDALEYIETVNRRTKGDMPRRIYTVLATLHPVFIANPHLEFSNGYIREYRSDGSGNASGLKLAFQYPMSWEESEGRRPHIVRKFNTHNSFCSSMLVVKKLPEASARMAVSEALKYMSSPEYLKVELPDAAFVSRGTRIIASLSLCLCGLHKYCCENVGAYDG